MLKIKTVECPLCKKNATRVYYLSRNNFHDFDDESKTFKVASDGYENAPTYMGGYVMCPECLEIFNLDSAKITEEEDSRSIKKTLKESIKSLFAPKPPIKKEPDYKEVIEDGLEFYDKSFKVVTADDEARYSVLLKYIWEIERLSEEMKKAYSADYNKALIELLEILEFKTKNVPNIEDEECDWILSYSKDTESMERDYKREAQEYNNKHNVDILLMAEFYRRKGIFERTIEILNENDAKFFDNYKKLADAIREYAQGKKSELFYLELER